MPDKSEPARAPGGSVRRKSPRWPAIAAAAGMVLLGALAWHHCNAPGAAVLAGTHDALLRIHGSNSIGDKLMRALVKAYMEHEQGCTGVHLEPTATQDEANVVGQCGRRERIEIFSHGSATGFRDLAAGSADIGMASDKIDDAQRSLLEAAHLGDLASSAGEHVIALDGIAVIVHPLNPVTQLSLLQLARIFSGNTVDWVDVGRGSGPIHVYAPDDNSGTWKFFNDAVLRKFSLTLTPGAQRIEKSADLSSAVAQDPQGVGFIDLSYVGSNKVVALSEQGVKARTPTLCTVKTAEYLLARRLYLYTATQPTPIVARFVQFATSREAWRIVSDVGLVNMDPTPLPDCSTQAQAHSAQRRALTQRATRLLANFTFLPGSSTLDTQGQLTLGYLVSVLSQPQYAGHRLLLIGYADDGGSPAQNQLLSVERASTVRNELLPALARGSRVTLGRVAGLGAQDVIASHETPAGEEKNRRVEVWVRE